MKKIFNKRIIFVVLALLVFILGGLAWRILTKEKPVNLDRNESLIKSNEVVLQTRDLQTRDVYLDNNLKTSLGSIPKLYIYGKREQKASSDSNNNSNSGAMSDEEFNDFWSRSEAVTADEYAEEYDEEDTPVHYDLDYDPFSSNDDEFIAFEYQDKDVTSLVSITPELRGTWIAKGDGLIFTPQKDWLANQKYDVVLNKELISPELKLKNNKLTFTTPEEKISIETLQLVKDVTQKRKFDIIGRIYSNFPFDEEKLTKNLTLTLDGKNVKPQITFDEHKRYAFIKYENVNILPKEQIVNLEVKYNSQKEKTSVKIPEESTFFKLSRISATTQKDDKNVPQQLLVLYFSDAVETSQLDNKVQAYLVKKDVRKITPKVLNTAKILPLEPMPNLKESQVQSFKFDFNDEKRDYNIYVKVNPVIVSQSGFKLNDEQTATLSVPKYPKEISIMGDGAIIPLSGSKTLNFVSLGVNKFEVRLARIFPSQINHLISQTYGNMKNPYFLESYSFNENNISDIFTKEIKVNADYKTLNYSSLDLTEYMKQGKGLFLVEAKSDYGNGDRRLIMLSDIGIIYKELADNTYNLYAVSMAEEKPLNGAKVEVLALNGTIIKTLFTNEEGLAVIPNLSDFKREKRPVAFLVKTDKDFAYIPVDKGERQVSYSKFDIYGEGSRKDLEVFAWTDRGLYWPGEKVDFALIAKNKNWTTTAGLPIQIRIIDSRGTKIFEKDISLTREGLSEFSYQLQEHSPIGLYDIDIYAKRENEYQRFDFLNSTTFKVEEYEEDKLKVSSSIQGDKNIGWFLTKEPLKTEVLVQNLYGSAAQGNEVKATARLIPTKFWFKDYDNYKFFDNSLDEETKILPENITLTSQKTDAEGKAIFDIDLNKYSKGTYRLRFSAEAFEQESSKSVSSYASTYVAPMSYLIGYKTDSNLSFLNKDSKATIDFIAINNKLEKIDLNNLTLALKEKTYISALTRQYDDVYRYQSVLQEKEISKQNFALSKNGTSFDLDTSKAGRYVLYLYNADGEVLNKIEFFVAGARNTGFNLERNSELTMFLSKETFNPGEEIEMNLITPYKGIGLITLEADKVYASKWFKTETNSSIQKIKIPADLEGGAYINISFVRSLSSPEIFVSPYSYTMAYVKINPVKRVLDIDLKVPQLIQPGEKLNIEYKTSSPAKIILFGSSEGILQVAGYKTPSPLNYFFRKKSLRVNTYQIFDLLLPDFAVFKETFATGGGAASKNNWLFENEFRRNRLAPVTFWSQILEADTTRKTYTYEVPDYFNGSIRVMAVAVNSGATGSNAEMVNVKSPVILNASAPRMAVPGDIFEVGLRIANEEDKLANGNFTAEITTTKGLNVLGANKQEIAIAKNAEKTIYFKVQAMQDFGNQDITFKVKERSSSQVYKTSYSLSLRPATPYKVDVAMGNSLDKKFVIKDFEMRSLYPYKEERKLDLSQNPLALFLSLETFLKNYPYGCTEQMTSKIFPRLAYATAKGPNAHKEVQKELDELNAKLPLRQRDDGSISLWDNGFGDDELTMYVTDMLLTAEELQYNIPDSVLSRALGRIRHYIARRPYSDRQAKLMAYGHYLLARNGESEGAYLAALDKYFQTNMPSYKKNIEGAYLAAAYQMLQDKDKAQDLIKNYETENKDQYIYYSDYDTSLTRNAKYLYLVAKYFPQKLNDKKEKELLKTMIRDIVMNNYNTMSASYSMAALYEYAQTFKDDQAEFKVSCQNQDLEVKQGNIAEVSPLPLTCTEYKVSVDKNRPLGNFWFLEQAGYDNKPAKKYSNGLEVYRELLDEKGEAVKQVKAGQDLIVKIKIKSLTGKEITNVAIVDMFASPFVFVRGSLEGSYTFAEPREDRLLIFGNYGPQTTTLTYKVKVANAGEFVVPAITAQAMYNNALTASGEEEKLFVEKR